MSDTTKTCKQCCETKSIGAFRKYYGGRKGTYTVCNDCQKQNARAKYIRTKKHHSAAETLELEQLEELWCLQEQLGGRTPLHGTFTVKPDLNEKLAATAAKVEAATAKLADFKDEPQEIITWLTCILDEEPEHYIDTVYEGLASKYRVLLSTNPPVFDESHMKALDAILARFYAYEDVYYQKGGDVQ